MVVREQPRARCPALPGWLERRDFLWFDFYVVAKRKMRGVRPAQAVSEFFEIGRQTVDHRLRKQCVICRHAIGGEPRSSTTLASGSTSPAAMQPA